jgi:hypothetical protein
MKEEKLKENEEKNNEKDKPREITLQVQTPRGLWSKKLPKDAVKRPIYPITTKIAQVITDAREVFKFTENDNKYVLLHGSTQLQPERTLVSYHFDDDTLLVLSVQGGNA